MQAVQSLLSNYSSGRSLVHEGCLKTCVGGKEVSHDGSGAHTGVETMDSWGIGLLIGLRNLLLVVLMAIGGLSIRVTDGTVNGLVVGAL